MDTHLASDNTTLAIFAKFKLRDGRIFTFSEYDQDVDYDLGDGDGTLTYVANNAITRSAIRQRGEAAIDNLQIVGHLESSAITINDLRGGEWDDAEYRIFMLNFENLANGEIALGRGHLGKVVTQDNEYAVEMLSILNRYNSDLTDVYSPACRVDLGSTGYKGVGGCFIQTDPPIWSSGSTVTARLDKDARTGTVFSPSSFNDRHFVATSTGITSTSEPSWNTSTGGTTTEGTISYTTIRARTLITTVATVIDNSNFTVSYTGNASSSHFSQGLVEWISTADANYGRFMEVLSFTSASSTSSSITDVELWASMPDDISTGVSLKIRMGCNKTLERCKEFGNIENFQGFPHIPGLDRLFFVPNPRA